MNIVRPDGISKEEWSKTYQKIYYDRIVNNPHLCSLCNAKVLNKTMHVKSAKHMRIVELLNKYNDNNKPIWTSCERPKDACLANIE